LPVDGPPLDGGWVQIEAGRISALGRGRPPGEAEDLGDAAILPGLVNAHTHIELSWLAGRVPPAAAMVEWIRALMRERAAGPSEGDAEVVRTAERALLDARGTGTVLLGDISNTLMSLPLLASNGFGGAVFYELLGFRLANSEGVVREAWARLDQAQLPEREGGRPDPALLRGVVAHAPYSVSAELFSAIARSQRTAPLTVHLAESPEEIEFLQTGAGPFRRLLEDLGVWPLEWSAPRRDPVEYLIDLGYLTPGCLVVHGVHLTPRALERLREQAAVLVTCPRSNEWVGAGMPPVSHFYASGVPVALGTDSLASVPSLNLFDELAALRRIAPEVSAASLIHSATSVGAEALGHGARYGTVAPGKRAELVRVRVPAQTADVEEYLVGGIPAEDIGWV
jgi:cytosine/adenosine deaminase-related metal-dependent hydrolase